MATPKTKPAKPSSKTKKTPAAPAASSREPASAESPAVDETTPFLAAARALPAAQVEPFLFEPNLAVENVRIGASAVLAERDRLRAELPRQKLDELESLEALASAVRQAAGRVDRRAGVNVAQLVASASPLRKTLLKVLDALASTSLLPRAKVDRILAGRGKVDLAHDLVDGVALLRSAGAPTLRRTPLETADLVKMEEAGRALLAVVKPKGAARTVAPALREAIELRDRLGTLLVVRHDKLWRAGAVLFGRADVDARVPPLGSRTVTKKRAPAGAQKKGASPQPPVA